jgi:hypothetical protein
MISVHRKIKLLSLSKPSPDIKKGQSRETGKIRYTRRRTTKQKHNTIYQTDTNNVKKKLLFVSNIMATTSCYLSATSGREQVAICQQHHDEKKLLFVSNIMARASYYLSATSLP